MQREKLYNLGGKAYFNSVGVFQKSQNFCVTNFGHCKNKFPTRPRALFFLFYRFVTNTFVKRKQNTPKDSA